MKELIIKTIKSLITSLLKKSVKEDVEEQIDLSRIKNYKRLEGVHKDILVILSEVSKHTSIAIPLNGGIRTLEIQKKLFKKGASKTLKSKHLTGNAVDVCPFYNGKIDWEASNDFSYLCGMIKLIAIYKGIKIIQGCKWKHLTIKKNSFKDFAHFELL